MDERIESLKSYYKYYLGNYYVDKPSKEIYKQIKDININNNYFIRLKVTVENNFIDMLKNIITLLLVRDNGKQSFCVHSIDDYLNCYFTTVKNDDENIINNASRNSLMFLYAVSFNKNKWLQNIISDLHVKRKMENKSLILITPDTMVSEYYYNSTILSEIKSIDVSGIGKIIQSKPIIKQTEEIKYNKSNVVKINDVPYKFKDTVNVKDIY